MRVCKGLYSEVETSVVLNGGKSRWYAVENSLARMSLVITSI